MSPRVGAGRAASAILSDVPDDLRYSLPDADGKDSYPISGTIWARTMQTKVVIRSLEMTDPAQLRAIPNDRADFEVRQAVIPCPELSRFLYSAVGGDWYWLDRLRWTYQQWQTYLQRPEHETWIGWMSGTPAGYFELETRPDTGVEIVYFGLLRQFIGQGLGGRLLSVAVERAWQKQPRRVWLHTCNLDHPAAQANYEARGFRVYREDVYIKDLPPEPPGPWIGAGSR